MPPKPEVILEDNHLLILAKPAGMPCQPDSTGDEALTDWAAAYLKHRYNKPGEAFVGLVHRLDRPVSGLVMLTRTSKALARLNEAVRERQITKRYLALVVKAPAEPEGTLVDFLLKEAKTNTSRRVSPKHKQGQRAELAYRQIAQTEHGSLLAIDLKTGRHHQIRVQLSGMGCPIAGDVKYGGRPSALVPGQIALHAGMLSLNHPVIKELITVYTMPPWAAGYQAAFAQAFG